MASPKNYLLVFLGLATAAAGTIAWREHQQRLDAEARLAQTTAALNANWQRRLADAESQNKDLLHQLSAAEEKAKAVAAMNNRNAEGRPRAREGGRAGGPGGFFAEMMDNPEMAKLWNTQQRGMLDNRYAALFKNLKLTPEQLDKFKNLLVDKQNAFRDVLAAARAQGLDPRTDRDAYRQLVAQANADIDANIQSLLGADGFQQYKGYEQTLPQRTVVNQLEQRLSYTNTPLNPTQADQLLQVLAQTATPQRNDAGFRPFGGPGRANLTDQSIAQASSVLTPDQVAVLQQMQSEQQAQREMMQLMRQQRNGGANGGAPATATPPPATAKAGG